MGSFRDRRQRLFDFDEPAFFAAIGGTAQGAYVRAAMERMRSFGYPVAGSGDPTNTIVRDGAGKYHADLSTTGKAGVWNVIWSGQPSTGTDTTKTSAVWQGEITVSPVGL